MSEPSARHPLFQTPDPPRRQPTSGAGFLLVVALVAVGVGSYIVTRLSTRLEIVERNLESLQRAHDTLARRQAAVPRAPAPGQAPAAVTPPRPTGPDPAKLYAVPVDDAPVRGAASAYVTIVEFGDYECPFCVRVSATLTQLLEQYKGDVRLAFRHLPLNIHKRALPAAHAAECARAQRQFWALNDTLFGANRDLSDEALTRRAAELPGNLKLDEWRACFTEHRYEDRIQRDIKLAEQFAVRGTPAFFINGHHLAGAQPIEKFRARIDEELAAARASGIASGAYYDTVVMTRGLASARTP